MDSSPYAKGEPQMLLHCRAVVIQSQCSFCMPRSSATEKLSVTSTPYFFLFSLYLKYPCTLHPDPLSFLLWPNPPSLPHFPFFIFQFPFPLSPSFPLCHLNLSLPFPALPIPYSLSRSLLCCEFAFKHCPFSLGYNNTTAPLMQFEHNSKHSPPLLRKLSTPPRPQ